MNAAIAKVLAKEIKDVEAQLVGLRKAYALLNGGTPEPLPAATERRHRRKGRRVKCRECHRGFIAHQKNSFYCCAQHRNKAWWRENGEKYRVAKVAKYAAAKAAAEKAKKRGVTLIPGDGVSVSKPATS
jgi:hypothetical protein